MNPSLSCSTHFQKTLVPGTKNRGCVNNITAAAENSKLVRKTHLDLEIYPDAAWDLFRVKAENPARSLRVFVSSTVFVWFMRILSSFPFVFHCSPWNHSNHNQERHQITCNKANALINAQSLSIIRCTLLAIKGVHLKQQLLVGGFNPSEKY